jgi:hypothetical protein
MDPSIYINRNIIIILKIMIIRPKYQNWYPKLYVPYFWNKYIISIVIVNPKVSQRGSFVMCFHPKSKWFASWFEIWTSWRRSLKRYFCLLLFPCYKPKVQLYKFYELVQSIIHQGISCKHFQILKHGLKFSIMSITN